MTQTDYGDRDWEAARERVEEARKEEKLTTGGVEHGFFFMRMYYLRGFENLMMDFATDDPHLETLIDMLVEHNAKIVEQWLDMDVDLINFGEDLGAQDASLMGPKFFEKYIAPAYEKLFGMCHEAGTLTALHSDGYIMDIMDQLLATGCDVINPQDLCNGVDNLQREVKGRACIRLDIDRQSVVPFGTSEEIHDLIEREVKTLGAPEGGLELLCGIYPPTPLQNATAVCEAMKEFRDYWWS
jgi:uroporphyrinogen-III decarboxylase